MIDIDKFNLENKVHLNALQKELEEISPKLDEFLTIIITDCFLTLASLRPICRTATGCRYQGRLRAQIDLLNKWFI